jgi:hypothetical protein
VFPHVDVLGDGRLAMDVWRTTCRYGELPETARINDTGGTEAAAAEDEIAFEDIEDDDGIDGI